MSSVYPPIVAFAGPKFAGKGTASLLLEKNGYVKISFARPIKDMWIAFGLTERDLNEDKEKPHPLLGGKTPRWALQATGTELGREMIWDLIWINLAKVKAAAAREQGRCVVFDDCRFDNEAEMLRALGATIVEITRPGLAYNPTHKSEAGLSRHFIDATIHNDGTPALLHAALDRWLREQAQAAA